MPLLEIHPGPDLSRSPCTDFNAGSGSDQAFFNTGDWFDATDMMCGVSPTAERWYSQDGGSTWSYVDAGGNFLTTGKVPAAIKFSGCSVSNNHTVKTSGGSTVSSAQTIDGVDCGAENTASNPIFYTVTFTGVTMDPLLPVQTYLSFYLRDNHPIQLATQCTLRYT